MAYLHLKNWIKTEIQIPKSLSLPFGFEMPLLPISEELHLSLDEIELEGF
ncbi:MAG: hypothetical protein IMF19_15035 [Proteobacteria bacterium]|nr:hypothetical protein [Pseudomonadota bacterium]